MSRPIESHSVESQQAQHLVLDAETAADLMTTNPISIRQEAAVPEAAAFLTDREIGIAPVIDQAGRPVGVLSRGDIVRHESQRSHPVGSTNYRESTRLMLSAGDPILRDALQVASHDATLVHEIMTPTVISVSAATPVIQVVATMLALGPLHHLFVVDDAGVLVGVISALDLMRKLRRPEAISS